MRLLPVLGRARPSALRAAPSGAALRRARPGSRLQRTRRARLRRWVAAGLVGLAVAVGLSAVRPRGPVEPGLATVVASRAIAAGAVITPADVRVEIRRSDQRPESAAADLGAVVGRRTAAPIEARGVITDERLSGAGLLAGRTDGRVAMTVPVMAIALSGVMAGGRVDLYATGTGEQVVSGAPVLAVLGGPAGSSAASGSGVATGGGGEATAGGPVGAPLDWDQNGEPGVTVAVSAAEARLIATHLSALSAGESFVLALQPNS